jgi:hypothetical protein
MKPNIKFLIFTFVFGLALVLGVNYVLAADVNGGDLQPAEVITYSEPVQINGPLTVAPSDSRDGTRLNNFLRVNGISDLRGTIVNNSSTATVIGGRITITEFPVTIGDDLQVDGSIRRREVGGINPVKFADSIVPTNDGYYGLGDLSNRWGPSYIEQLTIGRSGEGGNLLSEGTLYIRSSGVDMYGDLVPSENNRFNLGGASATMGMGVF